MQNVSAAFSPYADARWSDMKVSFRLVDTTAAGNAVVSATGADSVSQLPQTCDGVENMGAAWATLEYGCWPLDGTRVGLPDSLADLQTGFWSAVSDASGNFTVSPTLTFNFTSDHSSVGFTVLFDQLPKTFTISAYNSGGTLLDNISVDCKSNIQIVQFPVSNYRKLTVSFASTKAPYQRVKLTEVIFGIAQNFDRDCITAGWVLYEISPTADNLPSNELTIKIDNSDKKYNMSNPNGLFSYLQQSQPLDVLLGVGSSKDRIEYVKMGRFYYANSEADNDAMTAQITAYDPFYQLDKSPCKIGVTGTWTVAAAVAAVIADSGLGIFTSIPSLIGNRTIKKCVPSNATHREALRLIAQAGMSTCYFSRDNILTFVELTAGTIADTLDNNNMSKPATPKVVDRVNTIKLTVKDEYAGTESVYTASNIVSGETAQVWSVDNPLVNDGAGVAAWLLAMAQKRLRFEPNERGNPARELCDTVIIRDAYGENKNAVIIREELNYNGALSAQSRGWA